MDRYGAFAYRVGLRYATTTPQAVVCWLVTLCGGRSSYRVASSSPDRGRWQGSRSGACWA
jgi:hypothetical protein